MNLVQVKKTPLFLCLVTCRSKLEAVFFFC